MRITLTLLALILANTIFFSCKTSESAPAPSISFIQGMGYISNDTIGQIDSTVKFKVSAISNHNILKNITLSVSSNGGLSSVIDKTILGINSGTWETTHKLDGFAADSLTYTFTAIDDNGKSASTSVVVNLRTLPRSLKVDTVKQKIYNLHDSTRGAYDLNLSETRAFTEAKTTKDILDLTPHDTIAFNKSWGSGHGTSEFIKVDASVFSGAASTTFLQDEWLRRSGGAVKFITDVAIGDYYLVKTRQVGIKFDLYIIQITDIIETSNDNLDYIEFSYRGG